MRRISKRIMVTCTIDEI